MASVAEAMNLGTTLGIDAAVLKNIMDTSTASCWSTLVYVAKKRNQLVLDCVVLGLKYRVRVVVSCRVVLLCCLTAGTIRTRA